METERAIKPYLGERAHGANRILIVKLSSIGDVIHALPLAAGIKMQRPDVTLGWVVRQRCADLLRGNPDIDHLYVIPNAPRLTDLYELSRTLRLDHYEIALDLQGLLVSGMVTRLSGAPVRIGLDRNREANALFLTDASVPGLDARRHAMDILNGFMPAIGLAPARLSRRIDYLADAESDYADRALVGLSRPRIALNIGASSVYKRWPHSHWLEAATLLIQQGYSLVLIAGAGETEDATALEGAIEHSEHVLNLGGKTTLRQLASILARCDALITGDTGPMHLSAAVGTPTIALFGPTNPARTGPYGPNHTVIWKEIECSPCYRHPTCQGRVDCLRLITPQEVVTAVMASHAKFGTTMTGSSGTTH